MKILFFSVASAFAFTNFYRNSISEPEEFDKELFLGSFLRPDGNPRRFLSAIKGRMYRRQLTGKFVSSACFEYHNIFISRKKLEKASLNKPESQ